MQNKNLHFFQGNTVVCMKALNSSELKGKVKRATFNMPDPYFKKSQAKRRMINQNFLKELAILLDQVCGYRYYFINMDLLWIGSGYNVSYRCVGSS